MQPKYLVRFEIDKKEQLKRRFTVPLDYLRMTKAQQATNAVAKKEMDEQKAMARGEMISGDFVIPESLKMKATDTEKARLQKRRRVKALKYEHKIER